MEGGARRAVGYSPGMCARSRSLRLSQRRARADRQKTRVRAQLRGRSGSAKRRQGEKKPLERGNDGGEQGEGTTLVV